MAHLDQRCFFEDSVIEQLFFFAEQKQNGQVCFGAVVGLALEILKERTSYVPPENEIQNKKQQRILDQISQIVDQLSNELIHQMKVVYEECLEEQFRDLDSTCQQDIQEQLSPRIKIDEDPHNGIDISLIKKKLDKKCSPEIKDKKNIEFLFNSILNEENKVIPSEFTNLINLLEQYQTNFFDDDEDSDHSNDSIYNRNKTFSLEKQEDDQNYKYEENLEYLLSKINMLSEKKGQNKQYYDIMDDMLNRLLQVQTTFQTQEIAKDSQIKDIIGLQEDNMRLEQKVVYFETELHHMTTQKENIEYKHDKLSKEYDRYKQLQSSKETIEQDYQSALIENTQKIEAKFIQNTKEIEKKYEDIKVKNKQLQNENNRIFELYQQVQEELDSLKQTKLKKESSHPKPIKETGQKLYEEQILRLQEENKQIKNKLQQLKDEVSQYKQQFNFKDVECVELQKANKQLQKMYEESCVLLSKKPISFKNNKGRSSLKFSIKPLSGSPEFQNDSKKSYEYSMQFGLTRNSTMDTEEGNYTNYNSHRNTNTESNMNTNSYQNILNENYCDDQKQNSSDSQNNITSIHMVQEDNQNSICKTWPNHDEELNQKQNVITEFIPNNFDRYWDQFQNRMSFAKQNIQMQKQVINSEDNDNTSDPNHPQYYASFFEFNKEQLYSRDFLGLRLNKKIVQILNENVENDNIDEMRCFSDTIFTIMKQNEKQKKVLFATPYNIYILNNKNFKLIKKIQIDKITKISFLENSPFIFAIHASQENDEIMDAYSRADFSIFLLQAIKERDLQPFKIEYINEIDLNTKDKLQMDQNKNICFVNELQVSCKSAGIYGYLKIYQSNWILDLFSEPWKEYFFVLTNIGLISFSQPCDIRPQLYIPIYDAQIEIDPQGYNQKNCLKIYYQNSNQEYILSCNNKEEQDQWLELIKKQIRT